MGHNALSNTPFLAPIMLSNIDRFEICRKRHCWESSVKPHQLWFYPSYETSHCTLAQESTFTISFLVVRNCVLSNTSWSWDILGHVWQAELDFGAQPDNSSVAGISHWKWNFLNGFLIFENYLVLDAGTCKKITLTSNLSYGNVPNGLNVI